MKCIIEESGCDIPDIASDRTHGIGKNDPLRKKCKVSYCKI